MTQRKQCQGSPSKDTRVPTGRTGLKMLQMGPRCLDKSHFADFVMLWQNVFWRNDFWQNHFRQNDVKSSRAFKNINASDLLSSSTSVVMFSMRSRYLLLSFSDKPLTLACWMMNLNLARSSPRMSSFPNHALLLDSSVKTNLV